MEISQYGIPDHIYVYCNRHIEVWNKNGAACYVVFTMHKLIDQVDTLKITSVSINIPPASACFNGTTDISQNSQISKFIHARIVM